MSSDDVVLTVENISKCFEMYEKPVHRLYQTLFAGRKKFYKEFWALRDISFSLRRGECIGIIGRNGAGKSTLLQIVTGVLNPTCGSVKLKGRVAALLELGSGFNPEFTGRENVYMNASILGLSVEEIDRKYQSILDFADIGDFINQPVKTYSSGMAVRLAFAVIAHVDADVLIVDEALSVGDAFFQQKCMRFIRKFREEHTILFVSHDTGAIQSLCDTAILLDKGTMICSGSTREVVDRYLKEIYASHQDVETVATPNMAPKQEATLPEELPKLAFYDQRLKFINASNLRNDIEIFQFSPTPDKEFGTGLVKIESVVLEDVYGHRLSNVVGGERVTLRIVCKTSVDIDAPIVGFILKDRLGQDLFVENTFLTYLENPAHFGAGERFFAEFSFTMPVLAKGDYAIAAAVATGTQENHIQHHWVNEALVFKSTQSHALGLVELPGTTIKMKGMQ